MTPVTRQKNGAKVSPCRWQDGVRKVQCLTYCSFICSVIIFCFILLYYFLLLPLSFYFHLIYLSLIIVFLFLNFIYYLFIRPLFNFVNWPARIFFKDDLFKIHLQTKLVDIASKEKKWNEIKQYHFTIYVNIFSSTFRTTKLVLTLYWNQKTKI